MRIDFHASPEPTLGVEWELMLVDRVSRDWGVSAQGTTKSVWARFDLP